MSKNNGEFGQEIGLGDLPEDIMRERERVGGFSGKGHRRASTRQDAIGDVRFQTNVRQAPKEIGTIPYSGEVISTFESRPINAVDFSATMFETFPLTAVAGDATEVTGTYNVHGGYVGVLKGYRFEMQPVVPIDFDDLLADIFVNGVSQLGYRSLLHGQVVSSFIPCFILANGGEEITLKIRAPNGINSIAPDVRQVSIEFYGNLLQTTGAPLQLEIANKEIGLPVKTGSGPGAPATSMAMRSLRRSRTRQLFKRFRFF